MQLFNYYIQLSYLIIYREILFNLYINIKALKSNINRDY